MVTMGEGAPELEAAAGDRVKTRRATDMEDAVRKATALAGPGQAVVLSPAGASWDMYANFGARGDEFVRCVGVLATS